MEIIFNREYLQEKVNLLKGITKHKTQLPICRSILLNLPAKTISATDLEVSAITALSSDKNENVKVVIPAGTLSEILDNLKGEKVTLSRNDEDKLIKIVQGRVEIGLAMEDPEDFPEIEVLNDTESFKLTGADIIRGINKVLYAASSDESRFILMGILMQVKGREFRMCATDGFRIALLKKDVGKIPDSPQIVIPGRNAKILKELIDENDTVGIVLNDERVQFMTKKVTVVLRTLSGAYPDYEGVLSPTGDNNIAFIKRIQFLECLRRMAPIATKTDPIRFTRTEEGLTANIESQKGYAKETVDCKFKTAAPFDMQFNLKFLLDAVEHNNHEQLIVRYPDRYGVVIVDSGDYLCGIMPLKTDLTPIEQHANSVQNNSER